MGKVLSILIGVVLLVVGIWLIYIWWPQVWEFVQAGIAITAVIIGLGALAFGISELRSAVEEPPLATLTPAPETPTTAEQPGAVEENQEG